MDRDVSARFQLQVGSILSWYHKMHVASAHMAAGALWGGCDQIDARTPKGIAGCLYRYNASKTLMTLGMYLTNGLNYDPGCAAALLNAKLDIVLHAVNMADCMLEHDGHAQPSPQLREIIRCEKVGNLAPLNAFAMNPAYRARYNAARQVRNKIGGHMDWATPLSELLGEAHALSLEDVYEMVRAVDLAVHSALESPELVRAGIGPVISGRDTKPFSAPTRLKPYYH